MGMFGGKIGMGEALVTALNGYLAGTGNPAGQFGMKMMLDKLAERRAQADYQRQREDGLVDYEKKQQIDQRYAKPPAPHYWEDNTGNLMAVGPDGRPQQIYQDPNPWRLVPNGMGGVVPVNMQELMNGAQQGGPAPGSVIDDPRKAGGPMGSPPSGGFPYYR